MSYQNLLATDATHTCRIVLCYAAKKKSGREKNSSFSLHFVGDIGFQSFPPISTASTDIIRNWTSFLLFIAATVLRTWEGGREIGLLKQIRRRHTRKDVFSTTALRFDTCATQVGREGGMM